MADYSYVTTTGVIVPDTAAIQQDVIGEFREALGEDLIVTPDTPQGVLIVAETLARDQVARNNAALANQINPNLAGGVFLDAIWALTGGERRRATRSLAAAVEVTGVPGALIPAGARARIGAAGALFESVGAVILSNLGAAVIDFQSVDTGAVAAAPGALDTIVTPVLGWETVTNPTPAVLGEPEESDLSARTRRRQTLALQGVALPEAILSGVHAVPDVRSALFRENVTAADIVIEGVTLTPHSIFVCVEGGTDEDIAAALLRKKSLGAGWNGTTTVNVVEPVSGQPYAVKFQRPALVPIFAQVTVRQSVGGGDAAQTVRQALVAYANGQVTGEEGFTIGADVSPFELAGAISRYDPSLFVSEVLIGTNGVDYDPDTVAITIAQKATMISGNISVTVL